VNGWVVQVKPPAEALAARGWVAGWGLGDGIAVGSGGVLLGRWAARWGTG
jgi:hypothetical protein